jgi:hypothetical protein
MEWLAEFKRVISVTFAQLDASGEVLVGGTVSDLTLYPDFSNLDGATNHVISFDDVSPSQLKLAHDGLEREVYDHTTVTLHWAAAILVAIQFLIGRTLTCCHVARFGSTSGPCMSCSDLRSPAWWSWGCFGAPRSAADYRR